MNPRNFARIHFIRGSSNFSNSISPRGLDRLRPGSFSFRLESGEAFHRVYTRRRDQTLEKTGFIPKSNRMPYLPHSVKEGSGQRLSLDSESFVEGPKQ
jgi:hypothetical protein